MHDLGHGPFSHLFDRGVIPTLQDELNVPTPDRSWSHEDGSEMLFKYMIENDDWIGMDQVEKDGLDPDLICRLI